MKTPSHDSLIAEAMKVDSPDWAFRLWLITSFAYYAHDWPIAEDGSYDDLCKYLLASWKSGWRPKHNHGYLDEETLNAGTAYHIPPEKYPGPARSCAYKAMAESGWVGTETEYNPTYEKGYCILTDRRS